MIRGMALLLSSAIRPSWVRRPGRTELIAPDERSRSALALELDVSTWIGRPPVRLRTVMTMTWPLPCHVQMIEPAAPWQPWYTYGFVGPVGNVWAKIWFTAVADATWHASARLFVCHAVNSVCA